MLALTEGRYWGEEGFDRTWGARWRSWVYTLAPCELLKGFPWQTHLLGFAFLKSPLGCHGETGLERRPLWKESEQASFQWPKRGVGVAWTRAGLWAREKAQLRAMLCGWFTPLGHWLESVFLVWWIVRMSYAFYPWPCSVVPETKLLLLFSLLCD